MQLEAHLKAKKAFKCNWLWTFLCEYVSSETLFVEVVVSQHETCSKKAQKPLWFCRQDAEQTIEQPRRAQMNTIAMCRWQKMVKVWRGITSTCSFQQIRLRKCAFFVTFFRTESNFLTSHLVVYMGHWLSITLRYQKRQISGCLLRKFPDLQVSFRQRRLEQQLELGQKPLLST